MEVVKQKVEKFFEEYKKDITIKKLISSFNLHDDEIDLLVSVLYELEKEGKVISFDGETYTHVPCDYYLYQGQIQKSSKNNYHIKLKKGVVITIPNKNLNGANEDDIVFVEVSKGLKHDKELIGNVVRIVKKATLNDYSICVKGNIKKNHSDNNYYMLVDNRIIYISQNNLNGACVNDLVSLQIVSENKGKVIEILKRHHQEHVLEVRNVNGKLKLVSITNPKSIYEIDSDLEFSLNDQILVNLNENNEATFIKKIEKSNDLESYIRTLLYDTGFHLGLSEKSKEELSKINKKIEDVDLCDRTDLRDLETITIDGDTAKDLDDAISLVVKDDKYYLYVHIADVTSYVKFDSALFTDAYKRGTSLYPANLVFHMLDETLSSGVCSLNENEDKLTKTCMIEFDKSGNILDYSIFNSVIRSNKRMSYSKVNDILSGIYVEDYINYKDLLENMNCLSNLLYKKRLDRGAICFQSNEYEFDIKDSGTVETVKTRCFGPAHMIIENFMLVANQTVSSIAKYYDVPFVYRNHESPNITQISRLKSNLQSFKSCLRTLRNAQNPKILQKMLLTICKSKSAEECIYFSKLMLECMSRAYYDVSCIGHYALALDNYATFTSPIRRFPDLLNHYIIDKIIKGDISDLHYYEERYKEMASVCNENRLIAELFEQNIDNMLLNNYISKYKGQEVEAQITFITNNVIGLKVEGFIYGTMIVAEKSIVNGKFIFDDKVYQKGDFITVEIKGVGEKNTEVLFSIKKEEKQKVRKKV